jgi:hypothetical protein
MRSELRDVGRNAFWVDEIDVFDVDTDVDSHMSNCVFQFWKFPNYSSKNQYTSKLASYCSKQTDLKTREGAWNTTHFLFSLCQYTIEQGVSVELFKSVHGSHDVNFQRTKAFYCPVPGK